MKSNHDHAQFPSPGEIRIVRTLPGPIERIWTYLIDPKKRRRWFAGGPMDLRVGGKIELHVQHHNISPTEVQPADHNCGGTTIPGTILQYDPPRVLSYTFATKSEASNFFRRMTKCS